MKKMFCLLTLLVLWINISFAAVIHLKSGKTIKGEITERTDTYIKVDIGIEVPVSYYFDEIENVEDDEEVHEIPQPFGLQDDQSREKAGNSPTGQIDLKGKPSDKPRVPEGDVEYYLDDSAPSVDLNEVVIPLDESGALFDESATPINVVPSAVEEIESLDEELEHSLDELELIAEQLDVEGDSSQDSTKTEEIIDLGRSDEHGE